MKFQAVTLERGACYGPCPIYRLTIHDDGSVEWMGQAFVKEEGERSWVISQEKLHALEEALEKAGFKDLRSEYTEYHVTDHASARITVKFEDGAEKKVDHYFGDESAPAALERLEDEIDEIAGTKPYIGSEYS